MKRSETKKNTEGKSSDTPNRRGRGESLSQGTETPPVTANKPGKKKTSQPSLVEVLSASETEKTQFEANDVIREIKLMNCKLITMDTAITKMNDQFSKVMMKNDSELKSTLKDLLLEMKEDLLKSVYRSIEVLETKLFDKEMENNQLANSIKSLEAEIESQKHENTHLRDLIERNNANRLEKENEYEQYSRRNNILISGIADAGPNESARTSAEKVIDLLNQKKVTVGLSMADIDIAHRLPSKKKSDRDIIVRFVSRNKKEDVLKNRRNLKGTGIFINEDLTLLNHRVLMSVKRKREDLVSEVWSKNGKIFYKDKSSKIHFVPFRDYNKWIELPWPV